MPISSLKIPVAMDSCICHLSFYLLFGALHEAVHLTVAWLTSCHATNSSWFNLMAAALRYSIVNQCPQKEWVRHSGWMFSVLLASLLNWNYWSFIKVNKNSSGTNNGSLQLSLMGHAATLTAVEALITDLFQFIPKYSLGHGLVVCYCGNFGIILLNPLWLNVDGGRTALDLLEKMVEVTMMRGQDFVCICFC